MVDDCRVLDTRRCSVHHLPWMRAHRMADPISSLTLCQNSDPAKFCETSVSEFGYTRPRYCLLIVGTGGTTTLSLRRTYDEESAGSLGSGGIRLASRHCVGGADRQS